MSGKQDKRVRRAALGLAVLAEQSGKAIPARKLIVPKQYFDAAAFNFIQKAATNSGDSLRGIIRSLKKGLKKGA